MVEGRKFILRQNLILASWCASPKFLPKKMAEKANCFRSKQVVLFSSLILELLSFLTTFVNQHEDAYNLFRGEIKGKKPFS